MNSKAGLTIERAGTDERSFVEVYELMVALHRQGGYAPLDHEIASAAVYQTLSQGASFVARDGGKAIGALNMAELPFWYSKPQHTHMLDLGFFVEPEYRRGKVGVGLLAAVREEADRRQKIALITVTSPDRRPKKTALSIESQIAGYVPLGYTLKLR